MRFKKQALLASMGVWIIFLGIFILFLLALYQYTACLDALPCTLSKSDFAHVNLFNIFMFAAFFIMFIGIVTELCGVFQISKEAQDIQIFYNKLNLYFAASFFFALSLKNLMALSKHFFLISIRVSGVNIDGAFGLLDYYVYGMMKLDKFCICSRIFMQKQRLFVQSFSGYVI
ncbi:MAG: hypothetical protein LBP54_02895 [Campylobacteraceae bacterium]|nr:hypothetical protein [Campylobacteraceae bacterium]